MYWYPPLRETGRFSAIIYKRDNFWDFLFACLHTKSLPGKRSTLKGIALLPRWATNSAVLLLTIPRQTFCCGVFYRDLSLVWGIDYKDLSLVWGIDRKIRPKDHCLPYRGLPSDEGPIFLSTPYTHDGFSFLHTPLISERSFFFFF